MRSSLSAPLSQRVYPPRGRRGWRGAQGGEPTRLPMKWRVLITPRSSFSPQTSGNRREIPDTRRVVRQREATRLQVVCAWTPPPPSACHAEGRGFESLQPLPLETRSQSGFPLLSKPPLEMLADGFLG